MIRRWSGSSPDFFQKIKLVQNRAILDTSGGLSWHKRIDCPFCDELSLE